MYVGNVLFVLSMDVGGEEGAHHFGSASFALGVVEELVFTDASDGEIMGLGMGYHQAADTRMGAHGSVLGEADADGFEIDDTVEVEVEALVGQAGVTHGRTNALETLGMEVGNGQMLVGRITPIRFAHSLMSAFYSRFGQTVGKRLTEHVLIVVLLMALLNALLGRCNEYADTIHDSLGIDGADEICET